jgi:phosphoribosylglycinamide formyltransferase-1
MSTENNTLHWAFLCSFWGRNAKDTIKAHKKGAFLNSSIKLVIHEKEICGAAEEAQKHGIEALLVAPKTFKDQVSYQEHLLEVMKDRGITHIFLMGYQYLIREAILQAYPNSIVNIHPSLFPSFLATKTAVQDALAYGVKVTGITTHIIDERFDRGHILQQVPIRLKEGDTFESLAPVFRKKGKKIIAKTIKHIEQNH